VLFLSKECEIEKKLRLSYPKINHFCSSSTNSS